MTPHHYRPATPWCSNRLFEWMASIMMLQIGAIVLLSGISLYSRPQLAFSALLDVGLKPVEIGVIFLTIGLLRSIALRLNGEWILGPHIRVVCGIIGMLIWGQLFFGIIMVYVRTGEVYLSWGIWDTLLIGEYISIKRAILDIKRKPKVKPEEASEVTAEDAR